MRTFAYYIGSQLAVMETRLKREEGQGALEYIAIVVGLVLLVALGFYIAGVNIYQKASTFVQQVTGQSGH